MVHCLGTTFSGGSFYSSWNFVGICQHPEKYRIAPSFHDDLTLTKCSQAAMNQRQIQIHVSMMRYE